MEFAAEGQTLMHRFYLGTHKASWLGRVDFPLMVSRRQLAARKTLPRATCDWTLDSGGFSELSLHSRWVTPARTYVAEVRRFRDEIGRLEWAAIQDWMCEPFMLNKTGLSVAEHQAKTCASYDELLELAPDVPWLPVLQGWTKGDYLRHADLYERRGHRLAALPVVGLGSVCRRQGTTEAEDIIQALRARGLRLHGFGFKTLGLTRVQHDLHSSDSLAWSFNARKREPMAGCTHASCANCIRWARRWRTNLLETLARAPRPSFQLSLL